MSVRHSIGIDLGTTHCALARAPLVEPAPGVPLPRPEVVPVTQVVAKGTLEPRPLLPSFLYVQHESEGPEPLPWDAERAIVVGEQARARGVDAPLRVVASAKSWLCHGAIDRRSGVLPLAAPEDVEKISPVEASFRYLEHLAEAYNAAYAADDPDAALEKQDIVLTVPASFDAAARELTVEAATAAGFEKLTLLEEPQAALYAWIDGAGDGWRKELKIGDVILVVDVGGGTTDFSAITVLEAEGSLELRRIAVGDHILLGGDNMDLALAHVVAQKLQAEGKELDRWQMTALQHGARAAKERLLSDPKPASAPIVVPSRGSKLLGGSIRTELTREEVTRTLVDGFFPIVDAAARPAARARTGLTQLGLPYASDPAVTKHLAAFLGKQAGANGGEGKLLRPTVVLLNGGVMKSPLLSARLLDTLNGWLEAEGAPKARLLGGADLDLAVARGASYYGLARLGRGLRIRGGTARAYYVGVEGAVPAVPGLEPPITALCLAPFGMEEGTAAALPPQEFGVVVGEPVRFRFFGSTTRRDDAAGTELERWKPGELEELPPIEVTLPLDGGAAAPVKRLEPAAKKKKAAPDEAAPPAETVAAAPTNASGRREGDVVPVRLRASVTEVGTLLLEALPSKPATENERWQVELSVRAEG